MQAAPNKKTMLTTEAEFSVCFIYELAQHFASFWVPQSFQHSQLSSTAVQHIICVCCMNMRAWVQVPRVCIRARLSSTCLHVPANLVTARARAESRRSKGLAGQAVLAKILTSASSEWKLNFTACRNWILPTATEILEADSSRRASSLWVSRKLHWV